MSHNRTPFALSFLCALALLVCFAKPAFARAYGQVGDGYFLQLDNKSYTIMYRMYNPNSGEHFYTSSANEAQNLYKEGWGDEGLGWYAPKSSKTPVYRLYSGTDHHYTTSAKEKDSLTKAGWKYEGIAWYSDDAKGVALYRQFNPNVQPSAPTNNSGSHNYTTSKSENDNLVKAGWRAEGVGWYGANALDAATAEILTMFEKNAADSTSSLTPDYVLRRLNVLLLFSEAGEDVAYKALASVRSRFDWKATAKNYVYYGCGFSSQYVSDSVWIQKLKGEGYTEEEAEYGTQYGNWYSEKERARCRAQGRMRSENPPSTRAEMIAYLLSVGFRQESAEYGADNCSNKTW